ncbi:hypothetical protein [Pseudomonas helleri]|uniref:hypothetical protein n=1 Tax=Pseudomonas helleri TaxID=1608996 RepID=UPI003F98A67C
MANAKQKNDNTGLVLLVGFVVLIPLLLVSLIYYKKLKDQYPEDEHAQRVFDTKNLYQPFLTAGAIILFSWWISAILSQMLPAAVSITIVATFALIILYKIAKSISSTYFGVYVDPENDRVLLPKDMANYSVSDYFSLKFITELGTMEEVPLSQIKRITRQGGKKVFIHGKFGSRGMSFSNKQKRDECLSAIEEGCSVSASLEFEAA